MLKLNVRRGAGASTGGILCSASGSAAGVARAWPLRPWPFVPWSMLTAPILPVRRPWSAVTRSGAPQAPDGGGGGGGGTTGATAADALAAGAEV